MSKRILVDVVTPLGYRVILTRNRWREIVRFKHPAVAHYEHKIQDCLHMPDAIRASAKDADVHVYYLKMDRKFLCVVVAPENQSRRFVVTAYLTRRIKKGDVLWTK